MASPLLSGISTPQVRSAFAELLRDFCLRSGVTTEEVLTQALRDYFENYVPAMHPRYRIPKDLRGLISN